MMGIICDELPLGGVHKPRHFCEVHGVKVVIITTLRKASHQGIYYMVLSGWHDPMKNEMGGGEKKGTYKRYPGWRWIISASMESEKSDSWLLKVLRCTRKVASPFMGCTKDLQDGDESSQPLWNLRNLIVGCSRCWDAWEKWKALSWDVSASLQPNFWHLRWWSQMFLLHLHCGEGKSWYLCDAQGPKTTWSRCQMGVLFPR